MREPAYLVRRHGANIVGTKCPGKEKKREKEEKGKEKKRKKKEKKKEKKCIKTY